VSTNAHFGVWAALVSEARFLWGRHEPEVIAAGLILVAVAAIVLPSSRMWLRAIAGFVVVLLLALYRRSQKDRGGV